MVQLAISRLLLSLSALISKLIVWTHFLFTFELLLPQTAGGSVLCYDLNVSDTLFLSSLTHSKVTQKHKIKQKRLNIFLPIFYLRPKIINRNDSELLYG